MRFSGRTVAAFSAVLLAAACATPPPPLPSAESSSAQQSAVDFLEAFKALDSARFDPFFAEEATMFFPDGPFPPARVEGKAAVTAAFHRFFEMARERGVTRLNIQPTDLQTQDYGAFAVVSFHLRGNDNIGRRSIVMRRDEQGWRIVHFHASALEQSP